jgi:predicted RNase H-like HicB family nuclease
MNQYHINIFYSQEDDCFVADVPDLEGCSAFGETPEEAAREIMIAQKLWLEAAHDIKKPIPQPLYKPVIYQVS